MQCTTLLRLTIDPGRPIQNIYSKSPDLSPFSTPASQYWKDSRLLFLYLIDKLLVFNPDFRAAA